MFDALIIGLGFFLRIGVPILLVAGVGYVLAGRLKVPVRADIQAPPEAAGLSPAEWAKAITVPPPVPCWVENNCDATQCATCPAHKRSHVPCWLAVQVAEGKLRPGCANCAMYRLEQDRRPPYLRASKRPRVGEGVRRIA